MRASHSLRLRLLTLAAIAITVALFLSGIGLSRLFARHVEEREYAQLANHLGQIIAGLSVDENERVTLTPPLADPRFLKPNGGLYWQLDLQDGTRLRSRSLWDTELRLPTDDLRDGEVHRHAVVGPGRSTLLALERRITLGSDTAPRIVRLAVAVDRQEFDTAIADFQRMLALSLGILGVAMLAALLTQVLVGLRPLARLRTALQQVQIGEARQVVGRFPAEVEPLVADLNTMLERQTVNNQRARDRAADLAHGIKTPLAILSTVSRDLQRQGQQSAAQEIDMQVEAMGGHVRRELARARTVGALSLGQTSIKIEPVVRKVQAALGRVTSDRGLIWSIAVSHDAQFFGDEGDLLEILGNLTENASKWAAKQISIQAQPKTGAVELIVEDDGPGVPEGALSDILVRGHRLDETTEGSGIGLSIVTRIVDAYGGSLDVSRSALGGLRVTILLGKADLGLADIT